MEIQLQELIDKIKKDGIESATKEAARLKQEAETEARNFLEAARKEAAGIIAKSKEDADRAEKAGLAALQQASRNLTLSFKSEVQAVLVKIVQRDITEALTEETLKNILPELLKSWSSKSGNRGVDVLLSEKNLKSLQSWFDQKLASELKNGAELKPDRSLNAGFRIREKDGSAYYDYSAESVAELLSAYLNPRLAEIMKSAVKGN